MKFKNLGIVIGILLILSVAAWFLFSGESDAPTVGESPLTGSPFGIPETLDIPAASQGFEGRAEPLASAEEVVETDLFKIAGSPVAGFVPLARGTSTVVRYVDRATGHIFETRLPLGEEVLEKKRLTNNTLPQIYEAWFRPDGGAVLLRSLENETVKNMSVTLTPPRATSTAGALYTPSLTLLRGVIEGLSVGAGNTLFYVAKDSRAVVSSTFGGESVRTLLSTPFTAWQTGRFANGTLLFTKPSARVPGYAYTLSNGGLTKLLGPLNGLQALASPSGAYLLYSYFDGETRLAAQRSGGAPTSIVPATLAEKCVWSTREGAVFYCAAPDNLSLAEPDSWHQGKSHFSDYIWRFNAASEIGELVSEPKNEYGLDLDVFRPALSADERFLIFMNKTDLSLWALRL